MGTQKRKSRRRTSEHDHGYKRLFSQPQVVEELIRGFLREDWTAALDFSTLERVSSSFVSDDLRERHSDLIWRVRLEGEGDTWIYLYLLLEFQSTSYHFMAVRLLTYVSLLLEDIIRRENLKPGDRLPAVLPLGIHNGKRPWRGPRALRRRFLPPPPPRRRRLPRLTYYVLDQSRLDLSHPGLARNRLAAAFRIETSENPADLPRLSRGLSRLLPRGEDPALRQSYTVWFHALVRRTFPGVTIPETMDLEEVFMLEETAREWAKQLRKEGRQEGLIKGMQRVLLQQLRSRFGRLPKGVRQQVEQITSIPELEKLTQKVLRSKSLQEMGIRP